MATAVGFGGPLAKGKIAMKSVELARTRLYIVKSMGSVTAALIQRRTDDYEVFLQGDDASNFLECFDEIMQFHSNPMIALDVVCNSYDDVMGPRP